MSVFKVQFWKDTVERCISTFATTLAGSFAAVQATGLDDAQFGHYIAAAAFTTLAVFLKAVGAAGIGKQGTASLHSDI